MEDTPPKGRGIKKNVYSHNKKGERHGSQRKTGFGGYEKIGEAGPAGGYSQDHEIGRQGGFNHH
jgi:hypothetical protein